MKVNYKIENSKNGAPTLFIEEDGNSKYIHSKIDPEKEKERFKNNDFSSDLIIILGIGLGYHLKAIDTVTKSKILVIDKIENIEAKAQETNSELKDTGFHFISSNHSQEIQKYIQNKDFNTLSIIEHPNSIRVFPEFYNKIKDEIQSAVSNKAGNIATKNLFSTLYFRNIIKNLEDIGSKYSVSAFFDKLKDFPAIVISSAPSLYEQLDYIKKNQDAFILICVDSALSVLQSENIIPDFVISIDPQPWILEHQFESKGDFLLIESISAYKSNLKKTSLVSLNSHPVSQAIEQFFPEKIGSVDSKTGTVAGDAIAAAVNFGCNPIIITGMDFCFPKNIIYSRGTRYQQRFSQFFNNRFQTTETFNGNYIFKKSKNFKIDKINTRKSFIDYKNRLNLYLKNIKNQVIHITNNPIQLDCKVINNCGQLEIIINENPKNKKKLLTSLLTSNQQIKNMINFQNLINTLTKPDIYSQLIDASEITDNKKAVKYLKMLGKTI